MVRICLTVLALAVFLAACGPTLPPEPAALLADATAALGATDLRTIEYTGDGWDSSFGQAWSVQEGWPRWALRGYERVIDFDAGVSRHTAERQAGMDPDKLGGGGAQPGAAATTQQSNITPDSPWGQRLVIYFTPYGFFRLAAGKEGAVETSTIDGRDVNVLSFDVADGEDTYAFRGYFDEDDILERIETWLDDPVMGDMLVEVAFDDYQDVDGLLFPMHILERRGGLSYKELMISSVVPNAEIEGPQQVAGGGGRGGAGGRGGRGGGGRGGPDAGPAVEPEPSIRIGEGVWVVTGGYQSTVVEFADHLVVIEGAQNAARSQAIIAEARRLVPDKPIRYFVTTHTHFDHIGGIRDFVAEGATIIAHEKDADFYERALNTPHTLNPDRAQEQGVIASVQGVGDTYLLEDDTQRIELYRLNGSQHADDMMVAFIPSVGAVVESDLVQPWMSPVFGGPGHPFLVFTKGEMDRLGLDYASFISVHAPNPPPMVPRDDFEAAAGGD